MLYTHPSRTPNIEFPAVNMKQVRSLHRSTYTHRQTCHKYWMLPWNIYELSVHFLIRTSTIWLTGNMLPYTVCFFFNLSVTRNEVKKFLVAFYYFLFMNFLYIYMWNYVENACYKEIETCYKNFLKGNCCSCHVKVKD